MPAQPFTIRSDDAPQRPRRGLGASVIDEEQAWQAETGDVRARNRARLRQTRFVAESSESKPWSGNQDVGRLQEAQDSVVDGRAVCRQARGDIEIETLSPGKSEAPAKTEHLHKIEDAPSTSAATAASESAPVSMAAFYSNLTAKHAAKVEGLSDSSRSNSLENGGGASATKQRAASAQGLRRSPPPKTGDWFIERARAQMAKQNEQKQQRLQGDSVPRARQETHVQPSSPGDPISSTSTSPEIRPCPTCSFPLPVPLQAHVLRSHLQSIAHRLALPVDAPPASSSRTVSSTPVDSKSSPSPPPPPKLHLDAANRGYQLLANQGWKEGWGLGKEEWELLQAEGQEQKRRQQLREKETESRARQKQRDEAIAIGSDGEEEDGEDLFATALPAQRDSASTSRVQTPEHNSTEAQARTNPALDSSSSAQSASLPARHKRKKPLLVPLTVALKNNRLGLGRAEEQRRQRGHGLSSSQKAAGEETSVASGSTQKERRRQGQEIDDGSALKRRDIVKREEEKRRQWLELRQSLN